MLPEIKKYVHLGIILEERNGEQGAKAESSFSGASRWCLVMYQEKASEGWHDKVSPIYSLQHWAQMLFSLSQNVKCWCTQVIAQSISDLSALFGYCFEMKQEENIKKVQFYQHSSYGALETYF